MTDRHFVWWNLNSTEGWRSEEHTSELQSRLHFVCRLLLEKKTAQPRDEQELANVVIYFEPAPSLAATTLPRAERPVMRQEGLTFVPHVLAVTQGTIGDFPN